MRNTQKNRIEKIFIYIKKQMIHSLSQWLNTFGKLNLPCTQKQNIKN